MNCVSLTFSVVAEAHLSLAETNCVFSLGHAIELLKLCLIDTLCNIVRILLPGVLFSRTAQWGAYLAWEVDFDGLNTNVLRTGRHGERGSKLVYIFARMIKRWQRSKI